MTAREAPGAPPLAGYGEPGTDELRAALDEALEADGGESRLLDERRLKARVFRLRFAGEAGERSFVVKRLTPEVAQRTELVARRWLPAVGLADAGPPLAAVGAVREGGWVWHVYRDLGDLMLTAEHAQPGCEDALLELLAAIHGRFTGHHLLGECRLWGGDLGIHFYETSVRDALAVLRALAADAGGGERSLVRALAGRLEALAADGDRRRRAFAAHAGSETLLHGDLWTSNAMTSADGGRPVRLIDWDHVAVGPVAYDLSTLLLRFPPADRAPLLERYRQLAAADGRRLPASRDLEVLFRTCEEARLANSVIWPAIAARETGDAWAWEQLRTVDEWFAALGPVLDTPP